MRTILLLVLLFRGFFLYAQGYESLLDSLEQCIGEKEHYTVLKYEKISDLTDKLHFFHKENKISKEYQTCMALFYEYQSFIYDSAFCYIERAKSYAIRLNDPVKIAQVKINQGFVLLSSGLFKEAIDTLHSISLSQLPDSLRGKYYSVVARAYYDLADYNRDPNFSKQYIAKGNYLLDSALRYIPENTNDFWATESLRRMKLADWRGAKFAFSYWMNNFELPRHHYGIATSSLGYIYSLTNYPEKAIEYLIFAAIADIRTATKETVALRNLANALFLKGDKKRAYRYIVMALDDATFYNARHRKIEIATILPIIEGERLAVVESQKDKLLVLSLALTLLAGLVLVFLIVIYRQLNKIKLVRLALQETIFNLNLVNAHLSEANQIKEEYIGYFFSVNSEYIEKMDAMQKGIHRRLIARQYEELTGMLKSFNLKKERHQLYQRFDEIFLKLFPSFVESYKALFSVKDQPELKKDELLNSELRIFALMRLGIRDSEKVAKFLNFSVSTIYTYKTKVKSKSLYRDDFEEKIMAIKSV